jgi:uncharacterized membrane protein HdeD (DUF308 family)
VVSPSYDDVVSNSGESPTRSTGALELAAGCVEIIGGIILLLWESPSGLALGLVLGIVLIVEGALTAVSGFRDRAHFGVAHGIRGTLTSVVGVVLVAWPDKTPLVLAIIIGGYLVGFGFYRIMLSVTETDPASEVGQILVGSVAVIGGFIVIANPPEGIRLLAVIVALAALLDGVFRVRLGLKAVLAPRKSAAA